MWLLVHWCSQQSCCCYAASLSSTTCLVFPHLCGNCSLSFYAGHKRAHSASAATRQRAAIFEEEIKTPSGEELPIDWNEILQGTVCHRKLANYLPTSKTYPHLAGRLQVFSTGNPKSLCSNLHGKSVTDLRTFNRNFCIAQIASPLPPA